MQNNSAVSSARHTRIANTDHVAHALLNQNFWDWHVADLRHPGIALRTTALEHQDSIRRDRQIIAVNIFFQVFDVFKNICFAFVFKQFIGGR